MCMNKTGIIFIWAVCLLCSSCISTKKNQYVNSKQDVFVPKWVTDKGRLGLFPTDTYVSQLAYGSTEQESKDKACAAISEYIKASVISSSSASHFFKESADSYVEEKELKTSIQVLSDNNLYKLEYTNPYYYVDLGQFVCVAYINRNQAFNYVKPKLEIARIQFPKAYYSALEKKDLLERIVEIKKAQEILPDFYEVYDFARAILPEEAKVYEEVEFLASESLIKMREICSSVLMKIEGRGNTELLENSGIIAELTNQFKKIGFVVGNSLNANCITRVEVKYKITETQETFETYPELYIQIIENGIERISYAKKFSKVAGFDKATVIRRTNMALTKEIQTSFVNECF